MGRPEQHRSKHCEATNKDGTPCKAWAMRSEDYCRSHFELMIKQSRKNLKTGRSSKTIPKDLHERLSEIEDSPELMSMRRNIRLTEVRIKEIMQRLSELEETFADEGLDLLDWMLGVETELARIDSTDELEAFKAKFKGARLHAALWRELSFLMDRQRRLSDSERNAIIKMRQTISIERVLNLIEGIKGIIAEAAKEHKLNSNVIRSIREGIDGLTNRKSNVRSLPSRTGN